MFKTIAYHKNDEKTAEKNVFWQCFFVSHVTPNKELWLGDGVYFWERRDDAVWWPGGYQRDTILKAILSCEDNQFVNLDVKDQKEEYIDFCVKTKGQMESLKNYSFNFSRGKFQMNSFFFNVFKETYNLMLIKYSFPERNRRPQYCATDSSIVSGIEIIARTVENELKWC